MPTTSTAEKEAAANPSLQPGLVTTDSAYNAATTQAPGDAEAGILQRLTCALSCIGGVLFFSPSLK